MKEESPSVTLNQKLEIIKLGEKSTSKAERGQKARHLAPVSQVVREKGKFLKCYFSEHVGGKKGKQPYC